MDKSFDDFLKTLDVKEITAEIEEDIRRKLPHGFKTDGAVLDLSYAISAVSFNLTIYLLKNYHNWLNR